MAFMLATRALFEKVGLLDEAYPLYGEDMDWCYRASKQGIQLIYDPALTLTHVGGASADTRWSRKDSTLQKYSAERIFINKHYGGWHRKTMLALNTLKRLKTRVAA
jgi:N-acetylglucosaminyl-diphospho-decaprenol L-rhamnosyltransferase